jgi:hypothetical protein
MLFMIIERSKDSDMLPSTNVSEHFRMTARRELIIA